MFRNPTTDLIVVLVIVLLIFGPKRLPGLGKQLGQGIRDFKEGITGDSKEEEDQSAERPALTQATAAPAPAATPERKPAEAAPAADRPSAEVGSEGRS
jgi:sec-independent protein translocase protein TatA